MRLGLALLVAALLLLPGCLRPDGDEPESAQGPGPREGVRAAFPLRCDPSYPDVYHSGNAPLQPLFRKLEGEVAAALVEALGDHLPPGSATPSGNTYLAERGIVRVERDETGAALSWTYSTEDSPGARGAEEAEAWVLQVLNRTGITGVREAAAHTEGNRNGHVVIVAERLREGPVGRGAQVVVGEQSLLFTLHPWHNLSGASVNLSEPRAVEVARAFLDCEREANGTLANETMVLLQGAVFGHEIRNDSLALRVGLAYGPSGERRCGSRVEITVSVDARTGAVHGWRPPPCL